MARKERIIRVTSEVRDPIDHHQIAQILLDLLGPAQVEAIAEEAERTDFPRPQSKVWREEDSGRSRL